MQNLKELVMFLVNTVVGVDKAMADGKLNLKSDWTYFVDAVKSLPAAVKDITQVPVEWQARTEEQMAELVAAVSEKFDIADDVAEKIVERSVEFALSAGDFVFDLKNIIEEGKTPA